ncbi:ribonuclease H-like domain-containing protein, partial [Tanacetum coccineum]
MVQNRLNLVNLKPKQVNLIPVNLTLVLEPSEFVSEPVVNNNVECQPKVWSDAPIIEEYESDSEDEYVSIPTKEQETPSFANQQVKTPRETVKNQYTHSKNPKVDNKKLGYGFTARACFVCGSLNHLIRDCDFHEKRMAKQAELNNGLNRNSRQREIRQIWNNVQRVNKQNQFVPSAVLTRTGKIPVNTVRTSGTKNISTARHNFNRQAVLTSTAMKVNTVKPIVNRVRPANVFHKPHSPFSRPLNNTTALRTNFSKQKVNTAKVNAVSAVGGKRETAVKPSAGCNWRPQRHNWHNDYPHRALQNKGIVDSGCSRHMTGNKAYLAEYQDFNGGPVAFGGSKGYITGKVTSITLDSRQNNMYSFNLENIVPSGGLACLIAKATVDESNKWHRRLGHSDNGTEFKNKDVIEFCGSKGIKREYINAKTPQQNRVAKRKNKTLIEAARTMLADSFLPNTFWAEAVSTAWKGPTWLFDLDYLTDSMNYQPVRSENQANKHAGPQEANQNAVFIYLIVLFFFSFHHHGDSEKEDESAQDCFVLPVWPSYSSTITPALKLDDKREGSREEEQVFIDELERLKRQEKEANEEAEALRKKFKQETENLVIQALAAKPSSTNIFSTVSTPAKASSTNLVNTVSIPVSTASPHEGLSLSNPTNPAEDDSEIPPLEDIHQDSTDGIFTNSSYDDEGAEAEFTNLETVVNVSPIPTSRIHSSHPSALILGDPTSAVQTRSKVNKSSGSHAFVSYVQKQKRVNHKDFHHYLFACFLSQNEPKKISEALEDESWVDAMQEELLQ